MIYPPIGQLVEKTGNKYELVIATAKRARAIANEEKTKEKQQVELTPFMAAKSKAEKTTVKPIIRAISEIMSGKVYVLKDGGSYKSGNFEEFSTFGEALKID
ncbi:MAG: DNA-directed RNA polymerase subunit omega [Monoglobales bacterium]